MARQLIFRKTAHDSWLYYLTCRHVFQIKPAAQILFNEGKKACFWNFKSVSGDTDFHPLRLSHAKIPLWCANKRFFFAELEKKTNPASHGFLFNYFDAGFTSSSHPVSYIDFTSHSALRWTLTSVRCTRVLSFPEKQQSLSSLGEI